MSRLAEWPGPSAEGVDLFGDPVWQMTLGERAALIGVLHALRPSLAVEIGSMEGGSLVAASAFADEVHSFDLEPPSLDGTRAPNVQLHVGDSHHLLPGVLAQFAAAGRNVDYVLVDGDHSTEGVRRDIEDLLASPAISQTVIVMHDIANELVRAGCDTVRYDEHPKVRHVDLDFVPGYVGRDRFPGELWGGLGLIVVDAAQPSYGRAPVVSTACHHGGDLLAIARNALVRAERPPALADHAPSTASWIDVHRAELESVKRQLVTAERRASELGALASHHRELWQAMQRSPSWRATAPLRTAKHRLRGRTRG